jgi:hypothetical protein
VLFTLEEEHGLSDSPDFSFSQYRFQLAAKVWAATADTRAVALPVMAIAAFVLFARMRIAGSLLLEDEHVLAAYEPRMNNDAHKLQLFDTISRRFVVFTHHFLDLLSRVGGAAF